MNFRKYLDQQSIQANGQKFKEWVLTVSTYELILFMEKCAMSYAPITVEKSTYVNEELAVLLERHANDFNCKVRHIDKGYVECSGIKDDLIDLDNYCKTQLKNITQ